MSTSSRMRVTGFSGMDVESMVRQLMDAESLKVNKYKRQAISTEWKQQAYQKQGTALMDFNSKFLTTSGSNSMTLTGTYSNFKTSVKLSGGAESKAVGITANSNTKAGDYKIETLSTAKGATVTSTGRGMNNSGKGAVYGDIITGLRTNQGFTMSSNGKSVNVKFTQDEIEDIDDAIAAKMTADNTLTFEEAEVATFTDAINTKLEYLGTQYAADTTAQKIQDGTAVKEGVVKIQLDSSGAVSFETAGNTVYNLIDDGSNFVTNKMKMDEGVSAYNNRTLASLGMTGATFDIGGKTINITDPNATVQSVIDAINSSGGTVKASYDAYKKEFSFTSTETGGATSLGLNEKPGVKDFEDIFGITEAAADAAVGTDAVIRLTDPDGNESILESSTSSITDPRSGLSVTVNSMATDKLEVSVEKDTAKSVENIKAFVEAFNTMLTDLRTDTRTRRAKSDTYTYYEPLLDEEKEELSETQIEKLEAKAKEGILYNDSVLTEIVDQIESMMMEQVDIGGKKISLADIGITTTSDYTKGGILEIDEEKLTAYLEENSEDVYKLFTVSNTNITMPQIFDGDASAYDKMKGEGIAKRLGTIVSMATHSTDGSITKMAGLASGAKATDNELYNELVEKNNKINDMLEMLQKKEDAYYKKFSAMETAMSKANSQMSSLTSLLG